MNIIRDLWSKDEKYAKEDGIRRCWRKAGILPIAMETEINKDLGSASVPMGIKTMNADDCNELYSLMGQLNVKAAGLDTQSKAIAFQGSFVGDFLMYKLHLPFSFKTSIV